MCEALAKQQMTKEEVVALMKSSKSYIGWAKNCDMITRLFGGRVPWFWHDEIIKSGLLEKTKKNWVH